MTRRGSLAAVIIAVGLLLRLYQIDYNFDNDELFSIQASSGSVRDVLDVAVWEGTHPPLYHLMLKHWIDLFGSSEISARMPSVLASVLFLVVLYRIAVRWMGDWPAMFVVLIASVSPFFVYYGQQVRPYALVALLATLSVWLMLKSLESPAARTFKVLYGLCAMTLVYTQYLGVLVLIPQLVALAFLQRRDSRELLLFGIAGTLSIAVWLAVLGADLAPGRVASRIGWIGARPTPFALVQFYVGIFAWLSGLASAKLLLLLGGLAASPFVLRPRSVHWQGVALPAALALFGPAAMLLGSIWGPQSLWAPRQLIGAAAFFVVLLGLAIGQLRRPVGLGVAIALALWCVLSLPSVFPERSRPPYLSIANTLTAACPDCDIVVAEEWLDRPLSHYSVKPIHDLTDYKGRLGQTGQVSFLCRPAVCGGLQQIEAAYATRRVEKISWRKAQSTDSSTIMIYFMENTNDQRKAGG